MTLTADERRAINRENARHSTGPKSAEGKARSRGNAIKHGLRAAVPAALPNEDPVAVQARADEWDAYYRPQSPAARHLVDQCVRATLLADRCDTYHAAALARQVRSAESRWDDWRGEEFDGNVNLIEARPAEAVARLKKTARGCRWLIERWEELDLALKENGCWKAGERDRAIQLLGADPDPKQSHLSGVGYTVRLNNELLKETPNTYDLTWMLTPHRMPTEARGAYTLQTLPDRDACLAFLSDVLAEELALLSDRERYYRDRVDGPDRAEAADRALILGDERAARLFLRYHAESRTAFHRAYKALVQTLDRDRAGADDPSDDVSPNEPNGRALAPTGDDSPNGPNAVEPAEAESVAVAASSPNGPNAPDQDDSPNGPNAGRTTPGAGSTPRRESAPGPRTPVLTP